MIFVLVVFLLVIIFFAFFIGKNLSNICNFWFFNTFQNVSVTVLVLVSFAVGIVFSILVFTIYKIKQNPIEGSGRKDKATRLKEKLERKEQKMRKNNKLGNHSNSTEHSIVADNK